MKTKQINITPAPDRILVKISKRQAEDLTSKWIVRDDGTKVKLFLEPEYEKGYDRRWQQNVSVGTILAVGENVENIYPSDIAILDYTSQNDDDILVGFFKGDQIISIVARTTYEQKDAIPDSNGLKAWKKGDFLIMSQVLGVIRNDKVIAFSPYVFLESKSNLIVVVMANGKILETKEDISQRKILSISEETFYSAGDEILIKEEDIFFREIDGNQMSVVFDRDIIGKKNKV